MNDVDLYDDEDGWLDIHVVLTVLISLAGGLVIIFGLFIAASISQDRNENEASPELQKIESMNCQQIKDYIQYDLSTKRVSYFYILKDKSHEVYESKCLGIDPKPTTYVGKIQRVGVRSNE